MEPQTLIEDVSPDGNLQAFVEQDDRVAHFYVWGGPDSGFGTRACWVRNLKPGHDDREQIGRSMQAGTPPMLHNGACRHPSGAAPLVGERLRIVWFEEGDAAALLEDDELLAVIPGWSGEGGMRGYARDCTEPTSICWPLAPALETLEPRVRRAQAFWDSWGSDTNPWAATRDALTAAYGALGAYSNYYAIDGGKWPPKAMLRIPVGDTVVLVTLGVSLRPQPKVESAFEDPSPHRRIELGVCLGPPYATDAHVMRMARYVSAQSSLPWTRHTWLANGHTIACDDLPGGEEGGFTSVVLLLSPAGAPKVELPRVQDEDVSLLWLVPISEAERRLAVDEGSATLAARLWSSGCTWVHRLRSSVA
jgi:hypothetical protein